MLTSGPLLTKLRQNKNWGKNNIVNKINNFMPNKSASFRSLFITDRIEERERERESITGKSVTS